MRHYMFTVSSLVVSRASDGRKSVSSGVFGLDLKMLGRIRGASGGDIASLRTRASSIVLRKSLPGEIGDVGLKNTLGGYGMNTNLPSADQTMQAANCDTGFVPYSPYSPPFGWRPARTCLCSCERASV
jgi:hypothetical protein